MPIVALNLLYDTTAMNNPAVWDALAAGSWKKSPEQRWFHDYVLYPAICERLPQQSRILDYGCGSGELLAVLRQYGHHVVGFDPSVGMVKRARALNPNIRIVADHHLLGNEQFDTVLLNLVLTCVEDAVGVGSAALGYTRRLIITVPHPCFSLFSDLHTTTRRVWICNAETADERELYLQQPAQAVVWDDEGTTTTLYHRSISTWFRLFQKLELYVEYLAELVPIASGACIGELYERFSQIPAFMLFDLQRKH